MNYTFISNDLLGAGQDFTLHFSICVDDPSQFFPVSDGGGDVHVLRLVLAPSPHERLHDVHWPQAAQSPSTGEFAGAISNEILLMYENREAE